MIIIQARMTSTRLPEKVMLPLCGKPVLQVMVERLSDWHKYIIVATTNDGSERPILDLCNKLNIRTFEGDTKDVLGRYYDAAKHYGATESTTIVRLTSDCPLIDQELCTQVISKKLQLEYDMVNLGPHSGFPRGLDCCAFSFQLLERTHNQASSAADREHVTLGMAKFSSMSTYTFGAQEDYSDYRLTLDEPDDYLAIVAIYKAFGDSLNFSYPELLKMLKKKPELYDINKHVEQKAV
ncbi:polysaccharide biosynthesis protein [Pseudoalteromonas sp. MSK9-3]|uniref:glycosyltransferase family protein n=1 Tax=Pseudoalteromonas sp. MSK9-3 TaxID=1897633 RepID=UPI000EBEAECB|nr:glycosyltransferase family protein [Pseudoalteromonas sp. MSK9-3]RJE75953.1 polysaccharide biosynthesis protein [Pseudoalteromonas sp. MSK9-3]